MAARGASIGIPMHQYSTKTARALRSCARSAAKSDWCSSTSTPRHSRQAIAGCGGRTGFYEDYIWSAVDPNVFYFRKFGTERMLHSYNVATGVTTLVRDFTADLGGGYPVQWSRSIDDDVFAFTQQNSSSQTIGYQVWKRSTNTFLLQQAESNIDEVQIDKSGLYLVAKAAGVKVWDLQTGGTTQLATNSSPWNGFNDSDIGQGCLVTLRSAALAGLGLNFRSLATPQTYSAILSYTSWDQRNNHYSMLADDEGWALVTNEGPDTPLAVPNVTVPLQYELYQVATDGSGKVRRLVHHNSSDINYNRNAFGNISRDGKFIAWTSDWGDSNGRTDVYLRPESTSVVGHRVLQRRSR